MENASILKKLAEIFAKGTTARRIHFQEGERSSESPAQMPPDRGGGHDS
jgi:hypothetical protein